MGANTGADGPEASGSENASGNQGAAETPGLDLDRFSAWFDQACPGLLTAPLRAEMIPGGKSNITYRVSDADTTLVVRRPPLGHVLATAHDMAREHRVISALHGTAVPVPATYALCEDTEVIGAPFYVMEHVLGTPYRNADELRALGADRARELSGALIDTLADLHQVDPTAVGLGDFGRPEGFFERQVRRWGRQLEASRNRDLPAADELLARLSAAEPAAARVGLVHGDYRLDNALVDDADRIVAVLDWEMATLGDSLTDVALMVVYNRLAALPGAGNSVTDVANAPGFLTEEETLERYAAASGAPLADLGLHLGLAAFKLAVILEGIHYRHLNGQTVGAGFDEVGGYVEPLLDAGLTFIKEKH